MTEKLNLASWNICVNGWYSTCVLRCLLFSVFLKKTAAPGAFKDSVSLQISCHLRSFRYQMFIFKKFRLLGILLTITYTYLSYLSYYLCVAKIDLCKRKRYTCEREVAGDFVSAEQEPRTQMRVSTRICMHELSGVSHKQRTKCTCCQASAG